MPYIENTVRKGEIACYKQFLLFSECFRIYMSLVCHNASLCGNGLSPFCHSMAQITRAIIIACMQMFSILKRKHLTQYHTISIFLPKEKGILKTLWEKEKMLVTSIFSFSHSVFYPIREKSPFELHLFCCL